MAIPTAKAHHLGYERHSAFDAIRAEALFASPVQSSDSPSSDQVRLAVATALRRFGIRGCAARLAGEFGDHPDTAAARMTWALAMVRATYPTPSTTPAPTLQSLPLAS